jgi:hypothetical protein
LSFPLHHCTSGSRDGSQIKLPGIFLAKVQFKVNFKSCVSLQPRNSIDNNCKIEGASYDMLSWENIKYSNKVQL